MAIADRLPFSVNRPLGLGLAAGALFLFVVMAFAGAGPGSRNGALVAPTDYGKHILIENLYTGRRTVGADVGLPVVWFRLRNVGDRTVEEVKVRVSFLDKYGRTVHTVDYLPVHPGFETDGSARPLPPGDVWQMSFIRFYMPEGVPMTWQTGSARAEIVDLRLSGR